MDDCLKVAWKHQGYVYGDYVRDLILHENKLQEISLYFQKDEHLKLFLDEMGDKIKHISLTKGNKIKTGLYAGSYLISALKYDTKIPDDMDINKLLYQNDSGEEWLSLSEMSADFLKHKILSRQASVNFKYVNTDHNLKFKKLLNDGWMLYSEKIESSSQKNGGCTLL